jgi:hypothetical protein
MDVAITDSVGMAGYSVAGFNALPEFHESKQRFSEKMHVLDTFAEIIRAHGVQKYLGAALIHKHYALTDDERMVEEVRRDGSVLSPRRRFTEEILTPYLWHLECRDFHLPQWVPVEFVLSETVPKDVQEFAQGLPARNRLLTDLAKALAGNEAQDTFGLALLHRQSIEFDRKLQILLESPGQENRTFVVRPANPEITASDDWTQTYWHFDLSGERHVVDCTQHGCAGYCSLHK